MNKIKLMLALIIIAIFAVTMNTPCAYAGDVYSRGTATLGTSTGTGVFTNTIAYSALDLKRIWVQASLATNATVTVNRITSDGVYTQSVGSVATATATSGSTASFTAAYLKYGDQLTFSSSATTGATVMVEYLIQQP